MEVEYLSNSSSEVDINQTKSVDHNGFSERTLEFYAESATLGRLSLGQGSMASNDTAEYDLNSSSLAGMYSFGADFGANLSFRDADTKAKIATIGQVHSNFDGLDRDDRIRYDTPSFGGLTLSVAASTAEKWDAGITFQRTFGPIDLALGLGYGNVGDSEAYLYEDDEGNTYQLYKHVYSASFSILHTPSGLSMTLAGGGLSNDSLTTTIKDLPSNVSDTLGDNREDTDPFSWSAKLGYAIDATSIGKTSFGLSYNRTEDYRTCLGYDSVNNTDVFLSCGDKYSSYGFGLVQAIDKASTEIYFGARNHQLESAGLNPDDILTIYSGARVKF
ncbi:porin [Beggiatoa leptomitoformis]|uniref:Porin n=1 Tax=Beggiatoa leptomitoformis TaxID=288004 RepID=A0A2N9YGD9_9GAMM|nr:porin [Beggiatoa leptomitoformis]